MELELEDSGIVQNPSLTQIAEALHRLTPDGPDSFAILSRTDCDYIQTACEESLFVLEHRTPEPLHHYRAARAGNSAENGFRLDEVIAAFTAWVHGAACPDFLVWENIDEELGI